MDLPFIIFSSTNTSNNSSLSLRWCCRCGKGYTENDGQSLTLASIWSHVAERRQNQRRGRAQARKKVSTGQVSKQSLKLCWGRKWETKHLAWVGHGIRETLLGRGGLSPGRQEMVRGGKRATEGRREDIHGEAGQGVV